MYHRDFWNGEYYSYIVMELCKGNLADLQVNSGTSLPKRLLLEIFAQISDGLDFLHNVAQVCHRDLKPQNGSASLSLKLTFSSVPGWPCPRLQDRRFWYLLPRLRGSNEPNPPSSGHLGIYCPRNKKAKFPCASRHMGSRLHDVIFHHWGAGDVRVDSVRP